MNSHKNPRVASVLLWTVRAHWWLALGIIAAVIAAIVTALLPPLILADIIDELAQGAPVTLAVMFLYLGLTVLTNLTESLREGLLTVFGQRITHALRSCMMDKYRRLTTEEISAAAPGTIVSRFVGDVDTVENLFTSGIISMFADACKIISILVVIWMENRGLAIVLLILLPFLYAFTRHVQRQTRAAQLDNRVAVSRVSGHVPETIRNIRTIHCLRKEDYMESRYDGYIEDSYEAMERSNFYDAVYSPVIQICNALVVAVVMVLSASGSPQILTLFGMSAGTAVAVINYISQIFEPVESLGMEIQTIQSAIAGVHRINEFLALPERRMPVDDGVEEVPADAAPAVMTDVTFGYDAARPVLSHYSLRVQEGEQLTLVGRTGAGKSTIFRLLLGLYEPQEGSVQIRGMEAAMIPPHLRRRLFGYVEQIFHRVPGTMRDQITLYDESITETQVEQAARLVGLHETIAALPQGYETPCTPEVLSQGQWQLLSIARAVAAEPRLLLLDEITANLDAETERLVLAALQQASRDRTVLSISHRTEAMEHARIVSIT